MAPKHHHRHPPHPPGHRGASVGFVSHDEIEAILAPLVPDARDRALVLRCLLDEGPAHHRGANFVLLKLLALLAGPLAADGDGVPVPMRMPPHLERHDDAEYPLRLPLAALERLAPRQSTEMQSMIDCLLDGPPQHALANVVMVCLIDAALRRHGGDRPPG